MKKTTPKDFIIKLDVYPFHILVSIDQTDDQLKKVLKTLKIAKSIIDNMPTMSETSTGSTLMLPTNQTIIRLKTRPDKYEFMAIVAHEALHATSFILNKVGIPFDQENSEEAYTYLMQHICYVIYQKTIK